MACKSDIYLNTRARGSGSPYSKAGQRAGKQDRRYTGAGVEGGTEIDAAFHSDSHIHNQLAVFTKASSRTNANHTQHRDTWVRKSEHMCLCECVRAVPEQRV